jgi:parvulin-like peptidyl-prolyl isomerase
MRGWAGIALAVAWGTAWGQENPVVVRVDATEIRRREVEREMAGRLADLASFPPEQAAAMRVQIEEEVLGDLVGKALLVNAARNEGLEVTEAELQARLDTVIATLAPGGSVESFLQEAGISRDELAEDVRRNLLIQKLVEAKTGDVPPPTDAQIEAFYEANRARFYQEETVECRHVFVDAEGITDPAELGKRRDRAEALRKMLLENPGLDFARVSREKSDGPTAENGGYLGFMREADFLPEFTKAAFSQGVGEVGPVVQTQLGFHIIKVESKVPARQPELKEIRDRVRGGMIQLRQGEIMRKWIDEWRRVAKIERVPDPAAPPAKNPE